jgi:hypothetical protein
LSIDQPGAVLPVPSSKQPLATLLVGVTTVQATVGVGGGTAALIKRVPVAVKEGLLLVTVKFLLPAVAAAVVVIVKVTGGGLLFPLPLEDVALH